VQRSRKMEGSGRPYGLITIHAWLPMADAHAHAHARASKELPRTWKKCCSARCSLHPCTGQGLYMGDPTIGRATVMCRRALLRTPALANGAPGAVKLLPK
jgi:hypothetical protein